MAKTLMDFAAEARKTVTEISTGEVAELLQQKPDTLLLDVREPGEVAQGHLPGALSIPRGMLEPKADLNFPHREPKLENRDQSVVVYCASGMRSLLACATLQQMGFTQLRSMSGGFAAWQSEGREVASESW